MNKEDEKAAAEQRYRDFQNAIKPEDRIPPDEAQARFETILRAGMGLASRDREEEALRNKIRRDWGMTESDGEPSVPAWKREEWFRQERADKRKARAK